MMSYNRSEMLLSKYVPDANQSPTLSDQKHHPATLQASTTDAIKAFMLSEDLKPGDALPTEAELCESLGISRTSVREAMRKLEALDIVEVRRGKGSFVGHMSLEPMVETLILRYALDQENATKSLRQVVAIRRYLDLGVAAQLVKAMRGTNNPELHELVEAMVNNAAHERTYMDEDIAFHNGLLSYLDNDLLKQVTAAMWLVHQAFFPNLTSHNFASLRQTALAHGAMLDAAEAGDLDAYHEAISAHYEPLVIRFHLENETE